MRTTLLIQSLLFLTLCAAGASPAEAAERTIRPRRVNRSAPRVLAPVLEDGTSRAPLPGLTPPDSAIWKTPPEDRRDPPADLPGTHAKTPPSPAAPQEPQPSPALSEGNPAEEPAASPLDVPGNGGGEMNRLRQDFAAPLPEESKRRPVPAPRPAPEPVARKNTEAPEHKELAVLEEKQNKAEAISEPEPETVAGAAAPVETLPETETAETAAVAALPPPAPPLLHADGLVEQRAEAAAAQPTPAEVERYRRRLELRLLERYNNLPAHAGNVAKVSVVLSKPLQPSLDGSRLRAEFDQLVYDPWGKRIPSLEKEYYVVTFGSGGARQVRSDPSIRVGLNYERTYSEPGPDSDVAEKIRRTPSGHAFRAAPHPEAPPVKMPDWWRPEFADDGY